MYGQPDSCSQIGCDCLAAIHSLPNRSGNYTFATTHQQRLRQYFISLRLTTEEYMEYAANLIKCLHSYRFSKLSTLF